MRVVKWGLLLSFIIVGCTTTRHLPNKFHGIFYYGYNTGFSSIAYRFQKHTFKTKTFTDLEGMHEISGGTYRIAADTLVLNFKPMHDPDPSTYKFVKRAPVTSDDNKAQTLGFVRFKIVDHEGRPVTEGVNLNLRDKSHEVIKSLQPDSLGNFSALPLRKKIKDFMISPLARKVVIIPIDTLNGYNSKVKVILSDSATSYKKFNGTKKYLIESTKKDQIILKSIENNKRIVLEREGSEQVRWFVGLPKRDSNVIIIKDSGGNTVYEDTPWFKEKYPDANDRNRILNNIDTEQTGKDQNGNYQTQKGDRSGC